MCSAELLLTFIISYLDFVLDWHRRIDILNLIIEEVKMNDNFKLLWCVEDEPKLYNFVKERTDLHQTYKEITNNFDKYTLYDSTILNENMLIEDKYIPNTVYKMLALEGVLSISGISACERKLSDNLAILAARKQQPHFYNQASLGAHFNKLEQEVIVSEKAPFALTVYAALQESRNAKDIQLTSLDKTGKILNLPLPLAVFNLSNNITKEYANKLKKYLTEFAYSHLENMLEEGLACYIYYYPTIPIRALLIENTTNLVFNKRQNAVNFAKGIDSIILLLINIISLGYIPNNSAYVGDQSLNINDIDFQGGLTSTLTFRKIDKIQSDIELQEELFNMILILANCFKEMIFTPLELKNNLYEFDVNVITDPILESICNYLSGKFDELTKNFSIDSGIKRILGKRFDIEDVQTLLGNIFPKLNDDQLKNFAAFKAMDEVWS